MEHQHAGAAFLHGTLPLIRYHSSLGRHTLAFLLGHAIPAKLLPVVLLGLAGLWRRSAWPPRELAILATAAAVGLLSFVLQGKAYSYHRATLLAFLLCLAVVQLVRDLQAPSRFARGSALAALSFLAFWLLPASTASALRWNLAEPTLDQLTADLRPLAANAEKQGGIQCLDTTAGCITVLSRLRLVQSTGFLYDCYLFAPDAHPERTRQRERFLAQLTLHPPDTFVVTDQWCFNLPNGYGKLAQWPAFADLLRTKYTLVADRPAAQLNHAHLATWPFAYRIYRRRHP